MKIKLNDTLEAENISTACVNPYDVKFDIWNVNKKDFTAEEVKVVDALQQQMISTDEAAAILTAAGMAFIVCADCSDPEGHFDQSGADLAVANIRAGLDPYAVPVRQWLDEL